MTDTQNPNRAEVAFKVRVSAAELARARGSPAHLSNNSESRFRNPDGTRSLLANFTKGLPHIKETALVESAIDYDRFVRAIDSGDPRDFADLPLGPQGVEPRFTSGIASDPEVGTRAWESGGAGLVFDLEGPDAQAVTMPPAPELDSDELVAEVTECYWMSLLRDVPFPTFESNSHIQAAAESINNTQWIKFKNNPPAHLTAAERSRLRGPVTTANVFRGITPGDEVGPYLSQFLLVGTTGIANGNEVGDGFIQYGGMRMDQRVRVAKPHIDYMTTFGAYLDVQNAANVSGRELYKEEEPRFRFIHTPRDLATYVHFDALYQAYLNACIILLDIGAPFDSGIPFQLDNDIDKQQGFATFGGPHILSLVTEVATRALKAVRFQKFNVHRRLRPEAIGARVDRYCATKAPEFAGAAKLSEALDKELLQKVHDHNKKQNLLSDRGNPRANDFNPDGEVSEGNLLMPMAFPEGSPMHPAYGAGHATVAGACVTVLKAFFDGGYRLPFCYITDEDGTGLQAVEIDEPLTVDGELNKICSNISIGRNWAGVHYFTDYIESIRIGEEIAIGILQEQKLTFSENFSMTLNKFDGSTIRI
uniref:Vanadium-dependent haloperoxidase n=1 Tax=Asparagopsis taxiformis TaxID=260499 RepID=A0A6M8Q894_9FLOR|nr:vanadium-dependent haloperoxidase [Asparagopsis taxiformis]